MKPSRQMHTVILLFVIFSAVSLLSACAEEGEEGGEVLDCGDHGSAHAGHCHCDAGYLFSGTTCVLPGEITEVCQAHDADQDEAHQHHACLCPEEGTCPCDGKVETHAGKEYCVPELDDESE